MNIVKIYRNRQILAFMNKSKLSIKEKDDRFHVYTYGFLLKNYANKKSADDFIDYLYRIGW